AQDLEKLVLVHGTATQLKIDLDVLGDRSCGSQGFHKLRMRIKVPRPLAGVAEVAERLNSSRGGTGASRDENTALAPDGANPGRVMRRGNRALDEPDIVGAAQHFGGRFREKGNFDGPGEREEFVFEVEDAQLAAIAGGEFENPDSGFVPRL